MESARKVGYVALSAACYQFSYEPVVVIEPKPESFMDAVGAFSCGHLNTGCGSFHARIPSLLCWIQSVAATDEFPSLSNS